MTRIGILGAGQLGRMLALAGYPLEMDFSIFDTSGSPSAGIGRIISDPEARLTGEPLARFLQGVDLVTYEFENMPLALTQHIESRKPLHPSSESIRVCQNRVEEKALFTRLGIPTPAYAVVESAEALREAVHALGCPVVAKSTTGGYDGKGQFVIRSLDQVDQAWAEINHPRLIVEAFVSFRREISVIAARSSKDEIAVYPIAENQHHEGILRFSTAPAQHLTPALHEKAIGYIQDLIRALDHVGVLTLELFETEDELLANEMAPRVHNSGHWTIEGATCSQFENHLRAIAGLPLGSTEAPQPACMINIIGQKGDLTPILALPYAHLHMYGKSERKGRKIGHINVQAETYEELAQRVRTIASLLPECPDYQPL